MLKQEEIQKLFGIIVRKERRKRGLTQSELAERSNLDNTYISQIERGLVNPSLFTLHKIAWSLDLSEFDLFQKMKAELGISVGEDFESAEDLETVFNAVGNLNASLILTTTKKDDFKVIYCNNAFLKFLGSSRDSIIGKNFQDLLSNGTKNESLTSFFKSLNGSLGKKEFIESINQNGGVEEIELNASSVLNNNKVESHLFTLARYDTEDLESKGMVYPRIKKYKTLLKESHHRIRNNLAIIVGIIDVNILETQDEKLKGVLKETQLRISSIAHIHEMLMENHRHDSQTQVRKYLHKLTDVISQMYQLNQDIQFTKHIDIDRLEMHNGVTIGLLCNELITNSYKYAFDEKGDNRIKLTIKELNEDKILFSYEDNGSGFEQSKFEEADSLGLSLIRTFMEELKAKNVHLNTDDGFRLQFELETPSIKIKD